MWEPEAKEQGRSSGTYYMPETMAFVFCSACIAEALKESKEARDLYERVLESYRLPDCREAMYKLEEEIPSGKKLLDKVGKRVGIDKPKESGESGPWIPDGKALGAFKEMTLEYAYVLKPWVDLKRGQPRSPDFRYLIERIREFVRTAFNNPAELKKGKTKVTSEVSETLALAISSAATADVLKLDIDRLKKFPILRFGTRTYSWADIMSGQGKTRVYRYVSNQFHHAGYRRLSQRKLDEMAKHWYQCRVVYSGPKAYCDAMRRNGTDYLDPDYVSKEIRECDHAMGYIRERQKLAKA